MKKRNICLFIDFMLAEAAKCKNKKNTPAEAGGNLQKLNNSKIKKIRLRRLAEAGGS